MLQKLVINKIIDLLSKQFKLFDVLKYVKEPNELDRKVKQLERRIKKLEAIDYDLYLRKGSDE
tara:strand:- start:8 stop:196 length:189 start_codon:yes stop_codon:yes gene_type:complete